MKVSIIPNDNTVVVDGVAAVGRFVPVAEIEEDRGRDHGRAVLNRRQRRGVAFDDADGRVGSAEVDGDESMPQGSGPGLVRRLHARR